MSFLTKSTGQVVEKIAEHKTNGGDTLPNNTRVTCAVESVEWRSPAPDDLAKGPEWDVDHINNTWRVQKGPFENQVIFQKLHVLSPDVKKRDNALDFYAAADTILNESLLLEMGQEPTDDELAQAWTGKTADLILGVWKGKNKEGQPTTGNFVKGIFPANSGGGEIAGGETRTRRTRTNAGAAGTETTGTGTADAGATRRRRRV